MKSIRLNKSIRDSIVSNILKSWDAANPSPKVVTKPNKNALVDALYQDWRKENNIDTLLSCGMKLDYVNQTNSVYLSVVDEDTNNTIIYDYVYFRDSKGDKQLRIFKKSGSLQCDNTHPIYLEWKAQLDQYTKETEVFKKHQAKRADYATDIRAVLDSVNTTKQLVEAWPEVEQYIPTTFRDPSSVQLPAILPELPTGETK